MNIFRNVIRTVLALTLVVLSLSGFAASSTNKFVTVNISPSIVPAGAVNFAVTAIYKNTSPPGSNSTINSLILTLPAGATLSFGTTAPSSVPSATCAKDPAGTSIKCSNFSGVKPGQTFALTVYVNATANTSCQLVNWSESAFAGNSFSGDVFVLAQPSSLTSGVGCQFTGTANCGEALTGITDPLFDSGKRGPYNKDGSTCQLVNYFFDVDTDGTSVTSVLKWDTQPQAAFGYTVIGPPKNVDSTGWPTAASGPRPVVTWDFDPTTGAPINKKFAVACVSSTLPTPYGKLNAGIALGDTNILVDTSTGVIALPTAYPYPLAIGYERMQVTGTGSGGGTGVTALTVVRGTGGTAAAAHLANDPVMSTPLPIDPNATLADGSPNPDVGTQMQMCIAARGWTAYDIEPVSGIQRVRWWSYIFDVGDGFYTVGGGN